MIGSIGIPELLIILTLSVVWLVPVIVAIWLIVTVYRIRADQQVIRSKVESLERELHP